MNRFYTLIALTALAPSAAAQITISEDDIRPLYDGPSQSTSFAADDTPSNQSALQALAGQTGGGQTWDFSGLTYTESGTVFFTPVLPPAPGSDDPHFAQANLILRTELSEPGADESYSYSILDADEFTSLGGATVQGDSLQKIKFIPGSRQPLPYTFGSSWASESEIVFDPDPSPFPFESTTRQESEVVGWGTLVTPAGSAEALMVRSLSINTTTIVIFGNPVVTVDSSRSIAFTAEGGLGAFVFLEPDGTATDGSYSVSSGGTASEPVADAGNALRLEVGPNPARGPVQVEFELARTGYAAARVYDALGREVATLADGVRGAGAQALAWDASGVPAGVYVVRVAAGGGVATRRVAVAR